MRAKYIPYIFTEAVNPATTTGSRTATAFLLRFIITSPSPQSTINVNNHTETIAGIWSGYEKHANTISDTRHPPIPARCLRLPATFNNTSNTVTNNTDTHIQCSTAICRNSLKAKSGVPATHASDSEYSQLVKYLS